jgi:hypothetical protein
MKYLIKNTSENKFFADDGLTSDKDKAKIYDDGYEQDVKDLEVIKNFKTLVAVPVVETIDEVSTTNFSATEINPWYVGETFPHPYYYAWEQNPNGDWLFRIASDTGDVTPEPKVEVNSDEGKFKETLLSLNSLLDYKNKKYGNAALEPLGIFEGKCKVGQRLDDKLARIKNSEKQLQKNDVADLIGYLTLVCVENGWNNFDEFKD